MPVFVEYYRGQYENTDKVNEQGKIIEEDDEDSLTFSQRKIFFFFF